MTEKERKENRITFRIAKYLEETQKEATYKELQEEFNVMRSSISYAIKILIEKGYVKRIKYGVFAINEKWIGKLSYNGD